MGSFSQAKMVCGLVGITAHLLVFGVGEWDVVSPSIFLGHVMAFALALAASETYLEMPRTEVARCASCYVTGLFLSMLLYRAFFHRLSQYPGPFLARLSNFYITAQSVKKLHLFEEVQKLHAQYGDYVRIGMSRSSMVFPGDGSFS